MNKEERKTPKLRFPGFTDDWEQRKLGELTKDHNAGIYISKDKYGEGTNVIGVSNIYDSDIFDGEVYRLGPVDDDKFLLEEGDIVYGESSLVLEGIARTICVGKNGAGSAFAWHTRRVKLDKAMVNPHFATLELNYHPVVRKHLMSVATQTALTGMTTDGYFSAPLFLPCIEEQRRISALFINLDNTITLHQRKLEQMQEYKKGMLQKMFPKKGEKVPEVRFPGFTGDWERCKLRDVASIFGGNAWKSSEYVANGEYLVITIANVSGDVYINDTVGNHLSCDNPNGYLLNEGDILVSLTGNVGRVSKMTKTQGLLNQRVGKVSPFKDAIAPSFLFHVLRNPRFEKAMITAGQGAAQKNISNSDVLDYPISLPCVEGEQRMIGQFFDSIDNLITLHQRKLEQMKEYKKGLLQQMFV